MLHLPTTLHCVRVGKKKIFVPKVRQRKIIWFNPPYSVNVETNVGKVFVNLIDKHFPKTIKFHKIFKRKNVKVCYSCLPNFGNIIKSRNNRILSEKKIQAQPKCSLPTERYLSSRRTLFRQGINIPMQFEREYHQ